MLSAVFCTVHTRAATVVVEDGFFCSPRKQQQQQTRAFPGSLVHTRGDCMISRSSERGGARPTGPRRVRSTHQRVGVVCIALKVRGQSSSWWAGGWRISPAAGRDWQARGAALATAQAVFAAPSIFGMLTGLVSVWSVVGFLLLLYLASSGQAGRPTYTDGQLPAEATAARASVQVCTATDLDYC